MKHAPLLIWMVASAFFAVNFCAPALAESTLRQEETQEDPRDVLIRQLKAQLALQTDQIKVWKAEVKRLNQCLDNLLKSPGAATQPTKQPTAKPLEQSSKLGKSLPVEMPPVKQVTKKPHWREGPPKQSPKLGKWDGFRGVPWGSSLADRSDMVLVEYHGLGKTYLRKEDTMRIGQAQLDEIAYIAYKDQFWLLVIRCEEEGNFWVLQNALSARYGPGVQENPFINEFCWSSHTGEKSKVIMSLSLKLFTDEGMLTMMYWPVQEQRQKAAEEAAKKAGKDF